MGLPAWPLSHINPVYHNCDVIMGAMASQITSLTIVYSTVYSDADQRKHKISVSLAFVRGIHRWPVNSPRKWPVTRKMFPFDDVIIYRWQARAISARKYYCCKLEYHRQRFAATVLPVYQYWRRRCLILKFIINLKICKWVWQNRFYQLS